RLGNRRRIQRTYSSNLTQQTHWPTMSRASRQGIRLCQEASEHPLCPEASFFSRRDYCGSILAIFTYSRHSAVSLAIMSSTSCAEPSNGSEPRLDRTFLASSLAAI